MAGRWADTSPDAVAAWLASATGPWWFAGGWAIDFWLGKVTRQHSDTEIGCFATDLPALLEAFAGWEIVVARNKQLEPWVRGGLVPALPFSLWLRRPGETLWDLEILPEQREGETWGYRRDLRVSLPVADLTMTASNGHRVIIPEVQLLYKSKTPRPKDEADFAAALPRLSTAQTRWLRDALETSDAANPWLARLGR